MMPMGAVRVFSLSLSSAVLSTAANTTVPLQFRRKGKMYREGWGEAATAGGSL
jgi:hypothetical protein